MFLVFDTETTGLPKSWKAPVTDLNNWPRLVQLAWIFFDNNGNELKRGNCIIKPEGFEIPLEAARVHGISTEKALSEGIDLNIALNEFAEVLKKSQFLVAHNLSFDEMIIGAEFLRKSVENDLQSKSKICTMKTTTNVCKIAGPYGLKWPNLTELHQFLFNKGFDGAHDALADVIACADCFFELRKKGMYQEQGRLF